MQQQKVTQLIRFLRWLIYLVVFVQMASAAAGFLTDDRIFLVFGEGVWSQRLSSLNAADQLFVTAVLLAPAAFFL